MEMVEIPIASQQATKCHTTRGRTKPERRSCHFSINYGKIMWNGLTRPARQLDATQCNDQQTCARAQGGIEPLTQREGWTLRYRPSHGAPLHEKNYYIKLKTQVLSCRLPV